MEEKNEPIAGIAKDGVLIHVDYGPVKSCRMGDLTYGEICIKCNVCGRFKDQPKVTEREVRLRLCPHTLGPEMPEEGWGFDNDCITVHYWERLSSTAICGYVGRPEDIWSDDTIGGWVHKLCDKCAEDKA